MAAYKDRVKADLDRWIAAGHVAPDKRDAILASIPEQRRMDASTALAWVGGVLLGVAVIAFVSANWDALPRLGRFAIVLGGFLLLAGAGAWTAQRERTLSSNILLTIAALVFAAAIGLTGQIFDIAGDPRAAAYGAGVAAFALALAGRSTGAACVGLVMVGLGDFNDGWFSGARSEAPWMLGAAPLGAFLAIRWSSAPLAHIAALAIIYCFGWFAGRGQEDAVAFLFVAIILAGMAAAARWLSGQGRAFGSVFYGWFTAGALIFFAIAGYLPWFGPEGSPPAGIAHRVVWLAASGAVLALGRFDRHALVTAIGVLSTIAAICAILQDLGLELMAAAAIFFVCALAALAAGFVLRGRKASPS